MFVVSVCEINLFSRPLSTWKFSLDHDSITPLFLVGELIMRDFNKDDTETWRSKRGQRRRRDHRGWSARLRGHWLQPTSYAGRQISKTRRPHETDVRDFEWGNSSQSPGDLSLTTSHLAARLVLQRIGMEIWQSKTRFSYSVMHVPCKWHHHFHTSSFEVCYFDWVEFDATKGSEQAQWKVDWFTYAPLILFRTTTSAHQRVCVVTWWYHKTVTVIVTNK